MKKAIVIIFLGLSTFAEAQETKEPRTLFGNTPPKQWGVVLSPSLQGAQIFGEPALFTQIGAGLVLNQAWTIGGFVGTTPFELFPVNRQGPFGIPTDFSFYTYGGFLSYSLQSHRLLHFSFPLALGVIETDMDNRDWNELDAIPSVDGDDYRLFVEPGLNLELNIHKYVRAFAGVSYRFHTVSLYQEGDVPATGDYLLVNAGLRVGVFDIGALAKELR